MKAPVIYHCLIRNKSQNTRRHHKVTVFRIVRMTYPVGKSHLLKELCVYWMLKSVLVPLVLEILFNG